MVQGVNVHTPQKTMPKTREAMTAANTIANPKITEGFLFLRTPAVVLKEVRCELIIIPKTLNPLLCERKIAISEPRSPSISNHSYSIQDKPLMTHSKPSSHSSWRTKALVHRMKNSKSRSRPITSIKVLINRKSTRNKRL